MGQGAVQYKLCSMLCYENPRAFDVANGFQGHNQAESVGKQADLHGAALVANLLQASQILGHPLPVLPDVTHCCGSCLSAGGCNHRVHQIIPCMPVPATQCAYTSGHCGAMAQRIMLVSSNFHDAHDQTNEDVPKQSSCSSSLMSHNTSEHRGVTDL